MVIRMHKGEDNNLSLWTAKLCVDHPIAAVMSNPPSALDTTAVMTTEMEINNGIKYRKKIEAKLALWWWIICMVPAEHHRKEWAECLLGNNTSVLSLISKGTFTTPCCQLLQDSKGGLWIESSTRRSKLGK